MTFKETAAVTIALLEPAPVGGLIRPSSPRAKFALDASQLVAPSEWCMTIPIMVKKPSAFLPVIMSFAALAVVLAHVAIFGAAREADEGTAAHLWQLLMAAQLPLLVFFAIKWLPRSPKQALLVMALQASAAVAALAPVYFLKL
jgi:hypothetical protein